MRYLLAILVVLSGLTGCDLETTEAPGIESFVVVDSYQVSSATDGYDTSVGLNPNISSGAFEVAWSIDQSDYYLSLAVALDEAGADAIQFYDGVESRATGSIDCHFTTALKMSCGDVGPDYPFNPETDVSPIIMALPMDAYLLLTVCDYEQTECDTQYQYVELQ